MRRTFLLLLFSTLLVAIAYGEDTASLAEIDALIKQNEAKLKTLEAIKTYAEKNKLTRISSGHVDELSTLYQRH